ncbi:putative secondary metabolism biosynthetic enzyme [Eutypa lata]|nr:putative secondary metabolism biosynthetic enzyme [Eutypa lata]
MEVTVPFAQDESASLSKLYINRGLQSITIPLAEKLVTVARDLNFQFSELPLLDSDTVPEDTITVLLQFVSFVASSSQCATQRRNELLHVLIKHLDKAFLHGNDIHVYVGSSAIRSDEQRRRLIRMYYPATSLKIQAMPTNNSALFRAAGRGKARVYALLGGQGNTTDYLHELSELYATYRPLVHDFFVAASHHLKVLASHSTAIDQFPHGLDVARWIEDSESAPSTEYLISAPVSFPLIGLLQFVDLEAFLRGIHASPEDFPSLFCGFNGHSQGVVVAAAAATATSWAEFQDAAMKALTILFWIGVRNQQTFWDADVVPSRAAEVIKCGYRASSPMLAVSNIQQEQLDKVIKEVNKLFPADLGHIQISLVNCQSSFVVSGPRPALVALSDVLRSGTPDTSQHRIL